MPKLSNAPKRLDLEAYRGDTLVVPFQARDQDGVLDITGYSVLAQIRKKRASTTATAQFDVSVTDAVNGYFSILLTPAIWASIPYGETTNSQDSRYVWDVQLASPGGTTITTHEGLFVVLADVTRAS